MRSELTVHLTADAEESEIRYGFVVDGESVSLAEIGTDDLKVAKEMIRSFLREIEIYGDKRERMA